MALADLSAKTTMSVPLPSPPATASKSVSPPSKPPTTTTRRSCSSPWPTAWPKPPPNGCICRSAPNTGATQDEAFTNDELIAEQYKGIRPAPGYPACPDHTAKRELFALLDAPANAGMT
jgi:hypothetical protein